MLSRDSDKLEKGTRCEDAGGNGMVDVTIVLEVLNTTNLLLLTTLTKSAPDVEAVIEAGSNS